MNFSNFWKRSFCFWKIALVLGTWFFLQEISWTCVQVHGLQVKCLSYSKVVGITIYNTKFIMLAFLLWKVVVGTHSFTLLEWSLFRKNINQNKENHNKIKLQYLSNLSLKAFSFTTWLFLPLQRRLVFLHEQNSGFLLVHYLKFVHLSWKNNTTSWL
jgi:hypothetical protein